MYTNPFRDGILRSLAISCDCGHFKDTIHLKKHFSILCNNTVKQRYSLLGKRKGGGEWIGISSSNLTALRGENQVGLYSALMNRISMVISFTQSNKIFHGNFTSHQSLVASLPSSLHPRSSQKGSHKEVTKEETDSTFSAEKTSVTELHEIHSPQVESLVHQKQ